MAVNTETTTRKLVSLPNAMVQAIADFRFRERITTESEAIRRLIEIGLGRVAPGQSRETPEPTAEEAVRKIAERRSAAARGRKSAERAIKRAGVKPISE